MTRGIGSVLRGGKGLVHEVEKLEVRTLPNGFGRAIIEPAQGPFHLEPGVLVDLPCVVSQIRQHGYLELVFASKAVLRDAEVDADVAGDTLSAGAVVAVRREFLGGTLQRSGTHARRVTPGGLRTGGVCT